MRRTLTPLSIGICAAGIACNPPDPGETSDTKATEEASTTAEPEPTAGTTEGVGETSDDTTEGTTGEPEEAFDPAPGGLRRLLKHQYIESVRLLLGDAAAAAATPPEDYSLHGFDAIGASELALPTTEIEKLENSARAVALAAIDQPAKLGEVVPCVLEPEGGASCYEKLATDFGHLAWRRPLTGEEVAQLVAVAEQAKAWDDKFTTGLQFELMALLQSPYFLYMVEVGEENPEEPGHRWLTQPELATRLSFFLLGRTPDAALLGAAEKGELETTDQVKDAARKMLARPEARETLANFYAELLMLRDVPGLIKNQDLFPNFTPALAAAMVEETQMLIENVVWDLDGDVRTLFDAEYTFIDSELAAHYGVALPMPGWVETELPAEQERAGLLGHASILSRFAHPAETSPTRRGLFIRNKFLCEAVAPPPPGVDTSLPAEDPGKPQTMKQKLTKHMEDPSCKSCHEAIDPMGLALEHFNPIGAWRPDDGGLEIDASGKILDLGEFSGPRELAELLAADPRTTACVIKNFVRGGLGHIEQLGELSVMADLETSFAENGYRMQELLVELTASQVFGMVGEPK